MVSVHPQYGSVFFLRPFLWSWGNPFLVGCVSERNRAQGFGATSIGCLPAKNHGVASFSGSILGVPLTHCKCFTIEKDTLPKGSPILICREVCAPED